MSGVELKNSRLIQQQMASTLVQIYEGQKVIVEQFEQIVQRTNTHERQQSEDRAKLRLVDEKVERHEERLRAVEESARRSA